MQVLVADPTVLFVGFVFGLLSFFPSSISVVCTMRTLMPACTTQDCKAFGNSETCNQNPTCEWSDSCVYVYGESCCPKTQATAKAPTPAWNAKSCTQLLCSQNPPVVDNGYERIVLPALLVKFPDALVRGWALAACHSPRGNSRIRRTALSPLASRWL